MGGWKREGTLTLAVSTLCFLATLVAWGGAVAAFRLASTYHLLLAASALLMALLPVLAHWLLRRYAAPGDPLLLPLTFAVSGVGFANLVGASPNVTFIPRHLVGLVIGTVVLVLIARIGSPIRRTLLVSYRYLWALGAGTLGVLLLLFGTGPGGTKLQLFGFLPVEAMKPLLVTFAAGYLASRYRNLPSTSGRQWWYLRRHEIMPLLVMFLIMLGIFAIAHDFGPALTLYLTLLSMLYLVLGRLTLVLAGLVFMAAGVAIAEWLGVGVLPVRIDMWLSPWEARHEQARHLAHSLWAMATGGLWGSGIALGNPQSIPLARSDSVFATWGEQLGLVGILSLLALYAMWMARIGRIAQRASTLEDCLFGAGVLGLQAVQVLLICAGMVGLLPMTGMSLPFIALGNSALLANFAMVGMVYNISAFPAPSSSPPPQTLRIRIGTIALGMTLLLLGGVGLRCLWIQGLVADEIATRPLAIRSAKEEPHNVSNPRLESLARAIPRGRILDRKDEPLAETRNGRRIYPCGEACAQLVGWLDPRYGGPTGAEARFQQQLRGYGSQHELLHLYRRKDLPFFLLPQGRDVKLTISREAQQRAMRALRSSYPDGNAAFVLIEPQSAQVLVAVGTPTFDPNQLTPPRWRQLRSRADAPLVFRPVDGLYAPGSVFKVVTAAAALENGVPLRHLCRHRERNVRWKVGDKTFVKPTLRDHPSMRAHGTLGLRDALKLSCNLYFAHLAIALQPEALYNTAKALGIERVPLPDQIAPELPDIGFGQGRLLVSPLEVANIMATVERGGMWSKPMFTPGEMLSQRVLSEATAESLRQMMSEVVRSGTAYGIFSETGWEVYGKTGTAETAEGNRQPHGWFAGVARKEGLPPLAFALILEHGGSGRQAARVSRRILQQVLPALEER